MLNTDRERNNLVLHCKDFQAYTSSTIKLLGFWQTALEGTRISPQEEVVYGKYGHFLCPKS